MPTAQPTIAQSVGRIFLSFAVIYAVYFGSGLLPAMVVSTLAALVQTALTLAAAVIVEMRLFRQPVAGTLRRLGVGLVWRRLLAYHGCSSFRFTAS